MKVSVTRQGKRDLSVVYGFLVDVWAAQQNKTGVAAQTLSQVKRSTRFKK